MEFLKKIKVKTVAVGVIVIGGCIYGGKKLIEHIQDLGDEPEPLTNSEIQNTLGIGGPDGFKIDEETNT